MRYRNEKGNAWWIGDIRNAVEEKKKAHGRLLNKNVPVKVQQRRKEEYKSCKHNVKKLIEETKERVAEKFGSEKGKRRM